MLTSIEGKPVRGAQDLRNAEGLLPLGAKVKLAVRRDGTPRDVEATIEAVKLATLDGGKVDKRLAGVTLNDLSPDQKSQGLYGVALSAVAQGSAAYQAGLRDGDVIVAIAQQRINGVKSLPTTGSLPVRQLLLSVVRENAVYYVVL